MSKSKKIVSNVNNQLLQSLKFNKYNISYQSLKYSIRKTKSKWPPVKNLIFVHYQPQSLQNVSIATLKFPDTNIKTETTVFKHASIIHS